MGTAMTRAEVLASRVHAQQLDREAGELAGAAILDIGVQDTGPDGGLWALALRGVDVSRLSIDELVLAWTIRGAPHFYRRTDIADVAAAVEPLSDADAGKRIFDAAKPLRVAGIGSLEALDAAAAAMRRIVRRPMVKGDVSTEMTAAMPEPYLRFCRPCNTTHMFEQTFRLSALRAGLELQPGTSPPVLKRIPGFRRARTRSPRYDVIRNYLRLLGPATPKHVAGYLDARLKDVKAHWPEDATEVSVDGEPGWILDGDDIDESPVRAVRLLGPFDLFLQAKDRELLVPEPDRAKALWPVLGRPGAVLVDGEIAGTWRPRKSGTKLRLEIEHWHSWSQRVRRAIDDQGERLAAYRDVQLAGIAYTDGSN